MHDGFDFMHRMRTARFAAVIEAAGRPDIHVLLMPPEKDKKLQAAIRTHRVMTIHQERIRGKADYGTVGFDPGPSRQFLIFPRTISQFAGRFIVAIKYDALEGHDPKARSRASEPDKTARRKQKSGAIEADRPEPSRQKVIPFSETASQPHRNPEDEAIADGRHQLRNAIGFLEQGKYAAALKLLKGMARNWNPARHRSSN